MHTVNTVQGHRFGVQEGESILDAAARQGIQLPYSCRNGRCSSCKCRLIQGATLPLQTELGLSREEEADGWILTCVRTLRSDALLSVQDLGDLRLPQPKTLPCRIDGLFRARKDVVIVRLRLPPNHNFSFLAGQYIQVIGPMGQRRSYSQACAQVHDQRLELHIGHVPGGLLSQYWFETAQTNDLLRLYGPMGTFFLRPGAGMDWIFLATGTGISPIKAMLEAMAHLPAEEQPRSVTLYWGARASADMYWTPEIITVPYRYVPVLSRADSNWSGARGYVQDRAVEDFPDLSHAMVYACGSDAMIKSAKERLSAQGLPGERFFSDAFVASTLP